jgi:hypothetical protein
VNAASFFVLLRDSEAKYMYRNGQLVPWRVEQVSSSEAREQ